ncbi:MAG: hypothetical protein COW42_12695, partial [Deltaproteobacteria bacterium CG17_big_fil_post_rev_8_21_14_2_50_63_7]
MKKFGFAALVVMSLAFVGCDDGNSIAPSGATDCGSNTCSAGQYCEDPTFSTCSNGCLANTNCSSDQECVKAAGEQVGSCQNKTSSGTCPATPCGSGQVCSNGTCVTQTTGCPATPCGTGLTCENGTCVSTSTGGECAAFCTKAIACGAPVTAEVCAAQFCPTLSVACMTCGASASCAGLDNETECVTECGGTVVEPVPYLMDSCTAMCLGGLTCAQQPGNAGGNGVCTTPCGTVFDCDPLQGQQGYDTWECADIDGGGKACVP